MRKFLLLFAFLLSITALFSQTTIGTTTYDVQTNNGAKHRIKVYDDGTISAIWTGSTVMDGLYNDRGTFYQHYDGAAWMADPTTRLEGSRTGFSELLKVEDHEVAIAHDAATSKMQLYANDAIGSTSWSELSGSDQIRGIWAFTYCPEGTDDIYVVNADTQIVTGLNFSRSDDGGNTWTVLNYYLPFLTAADGFPALSNAAESYQIAVHGSDVYVLFGLVNSDLVLLHSDDYGNEGTWESNPIIDFPFDNYTGTVQSDIDGDGVTDTINTTDQYHNMIIEDDGTVHVFSPLERIYSDFGAFGYIVNNKTSGIWHWKTGMAAAEIINTELDIVNDDCANDPYAGIGAAVFNYRTASVASNPAAAWDPITGRLYCLFTMKIEYTDIFDDPLNPSATSFRDIFGMISDDGGATWSPPVNLTNTATSGEENFYLFANDRVVAGQVYAVWQQDDDPGTTVGEGDLAHENNILFNSWDSESFTPVMPVANFTSVADLGEVTFTNLSTEASGCYAWDFGDGTTSAEVNPVHDYATAGSYLVCLTASNPYGEDIYCSGVTVVLPPEAMFTYAGDPIVTFTDLTLNSPTSWSWNFGDGGTSTLQNPVHTFTTEGTFTVCLYATNGLGMTAYCLPVTIDSIELLAPAADFSFSGTGFTYSFTDLSTNAPTSWGWEFGDGLTSALQNPSHTYAVGGNYTVCLTATNIYGSDSTCKMLGGNAVENYFVNNVQIFPNPANDFAVIELGNFKADAVEVLNVLGQEMHVSYNYSQNNSLELNTINLLPGNYIVKVKNDNGELIARLIIE